LYKANKRIVNETNNVTGEINTERKSVCEREEGELETERERIE